MYCSQCGSKLVEDAVFCAQCGARVKPQLQQTYQSYHPPKSNKSSKANAFLTIACILSGFLLTPVFAGVVLIVAGYVVLDSTAYIKMAAFLLVAVGLLLLAGLHYRKKRIDWTRGYIKALSAMLIVSLIFTALTSVIVLSMDKPSDGNSEINKKPSLGQPSKPSSPDYDTEKVNWFMGANDISISIDDGDDSTASGAYSCIYRFNKDGTMKSITRMCNNGFYVQLSKSAEALLQWCAKQDTFDFTMFDSQGNKTSRVDAMKKATLLGYAGETAVQFLYEDNMLRYMAYDYTENGEVICIYHYDNSGQMVKAEYGGGKEIVNQATIGIAVPEGKNEVIVGDWVYKVQWSNGLIKQLDVYEHAERVKSIQYTYDENMQLVRAVVTNADGKTIMTCEISYYQGSNSMDETWYDENGKSYYYSHTLWGYD